MRLEVGYVAKAHGLKGEVIVNFTTDRTEERTAPGAELFLDDVAYEVASARPHQTKWLICFAGVNDRNGAEALRGKTITAEALDDADDDAVYVHELIGKQLRDQHGTTHGEIVAVVDNPASDLMELADGRLVPLAFYIDHDDALVNVEVPIGLLDDDGDGAA